MLFRSEKLDPDDPTLKGKFLQLPLYALAAEREHDAGPRPTRADYWFISAGQKGKTIGYDVTPEVLDLATAVIQVAVDGHREGLFPSRPTSHSDAWGCPSCRADGGADRVDKDWFEALLGAPELAAFRGVIA